MKKITFISDTHQSHRKLDGFLPGGDILIHAGDVMNGGYSVREAVNFLDWFEDIDNYTTKIFIAGNHDRLAQNNPEIWREEVNINDTITYLEDETLHIPDGDINIYGTPWQPEFCDWAFNLKRGDELKEKWELIPENTDILITHGPPNGKLDYVQRDMMNVGCHDLMSRINVIKPKINVFGHIHQAYGYVFDGDTHYINASVLGEDYVYRNNPVNVEWDPETNEMIFV